MEPFLSTVGLTVIYLALLGVGVLYAVVILLGGAAHSVHLPGFHLPGVDLHVVVGDPVTAGQLLCTVHADSPGELAYALDYAAANSDIIAVRQP